MSAQHQLCPRRGGQGHVAKPPWVAGDVNEWTSNNTGGYTCPVCRGLGVIPAPSSASAAGAAP